MIITANRWVGLFSSPFPLQVSHTFILVNLCALLKGVQEFQKLKTILSLETGRSLTTTSVHGVHWNKQFTSILFAGSVAAVCFTYTE